MASEDGHIISLDIAEMQILLYDDIDNDTPWQHRALLWRLEANKAK